MILTQFLDESGNPLGDGVASARLSGILAERLRIEPGRVACSLRRYPGPGQCLIHLHVELDGSTDLTPDEIRTVVTLCRDLGLPEMAPVKARPVPLGPTAP